MTKATVGGDADHQSEEEEEHVVAVVPCMVVVLVVAEPATAEVAVAAVLNNSTHKNLPKTESCSGVVLLTSNNSKKTINNSNNNNHCKVITILPPGIHALLLANPTLGLSQFEFKVVIEERETVTYHNAAHCATLGDLMDIKAAYQRVYTSDRVGWRDLSDFGGVHVQVLSIEKPPTLASTHFHRIHPKQLFQAGTPVHCVASPFGIQAVNIFLNSHSHGIVSKTIPGASPQQAGLILTDAPCLQGSEGGMVLADGHCIGMLTHPLKKSDKTTASGVAAIIPIQRILDSLMTVRQTTTSLKLNNTSNNKKNHNKNNTSSAHTLPPPPPLPPRARVPPSMSTAPPSTLPTPIQTIIPSVVPILVNGKLWGSGIFLSQKGYILTNAHVINPTYKSRGNGGTSNPTIIRIPPPPPLREHSIQVRIPLDFTTTQATTAKGSGNTATTRWVEAKTVFVSSEYWDFAVIKISLEPSQAMDVCVASLMMMTDDEIGTNPECGDPVFAVGYGAFDPSCEFAPFVSRGVLGRHVCNQSDGSVFRLQASAVTFNGSSGGGLFWLDWTRGNKWRLLGLLSSNLDHSIHGIITRLSYAVDVRELLPYLKEAVETNDMSSLNKFKDGADGRHNTIRVWKDLPTKVYHQKGVVRMSKL